MKSTFYSLLFIFSSISLFAQSPGDTIEVETFNYSQTYGINQWSGGIRDTMITFPNDPNVSYEKILMLYNMRCKDGNVSTGTERDKGCGEWDISCNTYLHDSTSIDSLATTISSHTISNFSGTTFNYSTSPTYDYYRHLQPNATIVNTINENPFVIGSGTMSLNHVLPTANYNGKSQYLFTATELLAAGMSAGNLDGLMLQVLNGTESADFLRVKIKSTTKTALSASLPDMTGFTEVFFHNTNFISGQNRLQFSTPFNWDGISNLIIEFSFTNQNNGNTVNFGGTNTGMDYGIHSDGDRIHYFNGTNQIQANNYTGIGGSGDRTMESWINSSVANKEIISWGVNSSTEKWSFRINGNGTVRAEVNGGYIYGTTVVSNGQWHHVACVLSGNDIANAKLYVDGVLETVGASQSHTVNTNASTNLNIGHGRNNTYFNGNIDEVRIWNTALSGTTLQNWLYKSIDATHPNYANLDLYYPLNEGTGDAITDYSNNGNNATIQNGAVWQKMQGVDLFKGFQVTQTRPNVTFLQGTYNLNIIIDTVYEAIQRTANIVNHNQIFPNYGQVKHDSIGLISSSNYWEAGGYENYYDENGLLYNSILIPIDGTITPTTLTYQRRFPMKYEIMSFVTPYGVNLDLGQNGKTWTFDVTDYAPILNGTKRLTIERGGQWMEDMDIRFLYIVGTPPRDVLDIQQIWPVESKTYTSIMADDSFAPKDMPLHPNGEYFKVRSAISGHGQEGEFIPRAHSLNVNGGIEEFGWQVWKECSYNPIFPQGGTWIYDRAGWCPGMATDVEESDLTPYITAGQTTATIDYGVLSGSGDSRYIANHQLVSYGGANFNLDARITDVISPSNKVEYSKEGILCGRPTIVIQNTGATTLTSLTIEYWVNNAATKQTYNWTGNLGFMEKEEVSLPVSSALWTDITGSENAFYAEISNPNGSTDEYSFNNLTHSNFSVPDVLPSEFKLSFRTNSQGGESRIFLYDDNGTQLFFRAGMSAYTTYDEIFNLNSGCYSLVIQDTDGDGIDFWANNDGTGFCRIFRTDIPLAIKTLEPDFGGSITYNFTVGFPLPTESIEENLDVTVFPNPASQYFVLKGKHLEDANISVFNAIGQVVQIPNFVSNNEILFRTENLPKGIYFINIKQGEELVTKRVIIE
jgi:hypothetical protein